MSRKEELKTEIDYQRERYKSFGFTFYECVRFSEIGTSNKCSCGRNREAHVENNTEHTGNGSLKNIKQYHSESLYRSPLNNAPYVRISTDSSHGKVQQLFNDIWKLRKPRLILSIIGNEDGFNVDDKKQKQFQDSIIDLALKSNAWLMTNAQKIGNTDPIGRMAKKAKQINGKKNFPIIGICPWGLVEDDREFLGEATLNVSNEEKQKRFASYQSDVKGVRTRLDLNHSHYIMLDNGTTHFFETDSFRRKLSLHLHKCLSTSDSPVPISTLVLGGNHETINNIYEDLCQNVPVFILDDDTDLSKFFSRWKTITNEFDDYDDEDGDDDDRIDIELFQRISEEHTKHSYTLDAKTRRILKVFKKHSEQLKKESKEFEKTESRHSPKSAVYLHVMYCLQPAMRKYLTIFNLNQQEKLTETFFRSICYARQKEINSLRSIENQRSRYSRNKTQSGNENEASMHNNDEAEAVISKDRQKLVGQTELIELAMSWDCIQIAKELIFKSSLKNIAEPCRVFTDALFKNKPAFVYEMLRLGFAPADALFDHSSTWNLYYDKLLNEFYSEEYVKNPDSCFAEASGTADDDGNVPVKITHKKLNLLLTKLVGSYIDNFYPSDHAKRNDQQNDRTRDSAEAEDAADTNKHLTYEWRNEIAIRDLFIWAILTNQIDLAKVFLPFMKYRICAALIASIILLRYRTFERKIDRQEDYLKNANYFEEYAVACVNLCDKADYTKANEIVLQNIDLFGGATCLEVAASARHYSFMSTACCAQAVDHVFYDKLYAPEQQIFSRLGFLLAFISFGLLAPFTIAYRKIKSTKSEDSKSSDGTTPKFQQRSITFSDPYSLESPRLVSSAVLNRYLHRFFNYHRSIIAKAFHQFLFYLFFILLFSYVLLFQFRIPTNSVPSIDWTEILLYILALCMFVEEVAFLLEQDEIGILPKLRQYFSDIFRIATMVGYLLFFIGFILRFTAVQSESDFSAARIVMAINVELWWIISLKYVVFSELLGPNIVAIIEMLKDLAFFIVILFFVIMGYGVASRSMVYYFEEAIFDTEPFDTSFSGRPIFRQIFYPVYYLLYGDFGNERAGLDAYADQGWSIATHVLLAFHLLFVNVLLINLLIAIFSKRYEEVSGRAKQIWRYQRYIFVRELFARSSLLPPISTILDLYKIGLLLFHHIRPKTGGVDLTSSMFKIIPLNEQLVKYWAGFEVAHTYQYAHEEAKATITDDTRNQMSTLDSQGLVCTTPDDVDVRGELEKIHAMLTNINEIIDK